MSICYLSASQLEKHIGQRRLFSIPLLQIYEGDRIGLIGRNGAGKSTLLSILSGEAAPDKGAIKREVPIHLVHQFGAPDTSDGAQALKEFRVCEAAGRVSRSGGEQTRLRLAEADISRVKLLFCDEPTANLDSEGRALLNKKLNQCNTFVLVSHDRELLNGLCNCIWYLSDETVTAYPGNYDGFLHIQETEKAQQAWDYERYVSEKSHLEGALDIVSSKASKMKGPPKRMGNSEARLHRRDNKSQEKLHNAKNALKTRLEKLDKVDRPRDEAAIHLDFSLTDPPQSHTVLRAEHVSFGYDRPLFCDASFELPLGSKTALLGPNGTGKSTLLRLIREEAEGIRKTPKAKLGVFCQEFETLDLNKSVLQNALKHSIQSETVVRTVLSRLMFSRDEINKPASVLSGGERVKLAFAQLFVGPAYVLLLDEPTNYLDILSLSVLETMLREYEGTVLFVSHDQAFVSALAARLLILENGRLQTFEGTLPIYQQKQSVHANTAFDRTRLQMRLSQLTDSIGHANPVEKERLEAEYAACLREYRALGEA
jgi:macrolide transport system ATP-binding/permease protein